MQFWTGGLGATKSRYDPHSMVLTYHRAVEQAKWAEKAGFGGITATEHHFEYNWWWGSPLASLATLAFATGKVRLSPGTMLLPLHDPLRVAGDAALLDVLSNGRLWLGFGYGYRPMEFLGLGTEKKTRGARLVEQLQILRLALSEDCFSYTGKYYHYDNVRVRPRPIQQPPPMWFQASTFLAGATRAGKNGLWYMCANLSFEDFKERVAEYYRAVEEAGVDRGRLRLGAVKDMVIAKTRQEAEQIRDFLLAGSYFGEHISSYGYLVDREGSQVFDEARQESRFLHWRDSIWVGTPQDAIDEYEKYRAMDVKVVMNIAAPGDLFTTQVLPYFKQPEKQ